MKAILSLIVRDTVHGIDMRRVLAEIEAPTPHDLHTHARRALEWAAQPSRKREGESVVAVELDMLDQRGCVARTWSVQHGALEWVRIEGCPYARQYLEWRDHQ